MLLWCGINAALPIIPFTVNIYSETPPFPVSKTEFSVTMIDNTFITDRNPAAWILFAAIVTTLFLVYCIIQKNGLLVQKRPRK